MNKVYQFIKKVGQLVKDHWPAVVSLGAAAWEKYGGQVSLWVNHHPKLAFWSGLVSFVVAYYLKSPRQKGS